LPELLLHRTEITPNTSNDANNDTNIPIALGRGSVVEEGPSGFGSLAIVKSEEKTNPERIPSRIS